MTRLLCCVSPTLVVVVLVHIYTAQGSIFTQLKDGESPTGCSLRNDMLMEYCLSPAEIEAVRNGTVNLQDLLDSRKDRASSDSRGRRRKAGQIVPYGGGKSNSALPSTSNHVGDLTTSLSASEDREEAETGPRVVNGAACLVSSTSGGTSMYLCQHGSWMAFKKLGDNLVVSKALEKSRVKRQYTYVNVQVVDSRQQCSGILWWTHCWTVYFLKSVSNAVPKITCPTIPDFVASAGMDQAREKEKETSY